MCGGARPSLLNFQPLNFFLRVPFKWCFLQLTVKIEFWSPGYITHAHTVIPPLKHPRQGSMQLERTHAPPDQRYSSRYSSLAIALATPLTDAVFNNTRHHGNHVSQYSDCPGLVQAKARIQGVAIRPALVEEHINNDQNTSIT